MMRMLLARMHSRHYSSEGLYVFIIAFSNADAAKESGHIQCY